MTAVQEPERPSRISAVLAHPAVRVGVPVGIILIAVTVLHRFASEVHWSDVKADVAAASWLSLAKALGATALCYVAFALYDVLGVVSAARGRVPLRVAGLAGASGFAVSNLLGFAYLTGTAVRYRIYAALGLDFERLGAVVSSSFVALGLGLALIIGSLLVVQPPGLGAILPFAGWMETVIGWAVLAALAGAYAWLALGRRRLAFGGTGIDLPSLPVALGLTGAAVLDIMGASLTLYVLMPGDLVRSFPFFFVVYTSAMAFGMASNSPGGLGVFEAVLIAGLGAAGRPDVLAALLLYRIVYTVLPFAIASSGLAVAWAVTQGPAVAGGAALVRRFIQPLVPLVASGVALTAGLVLLVSGSLPGDGDRLEVLRDIVPLPFAEASHLAGSVVGLLLVVVARGLYLRRYRAWVAAMGLMAFGAAASLAKGLDWEEAVAMLGSIAVLGLFRSAFHRRDDAPLFRLTLPWLAGVVGLMAVAFWVGLFANSHVAYSDQPWWRFAWDGDASRFLRASLAVAVCFAVLLVNAYVLGRAPAGRAQGVPGGVPEAVRRLVAASPETEAWLALTGDKSFLVADDGRAFLAYADTGAALIAKGDPVGEAEAGRGLLWKLREMADREGRRCAFYGVSPAFLPTFLDLGLTILKIGEIARVDLSDFSLEGSKRKDLRQARARAGRDGYAFEVIPAAALGPVFPELKRVSDAWLAAHHGEEKGFALGRFDEGYLANFDHAVLREAATGRIVAFANILQSAGRNELSLDLMRHDPEGPSVAMDALFANLLVWGREQGFRWFSLGAAPLAGIESRRLASLWNRIGRFVYEHGEHFYHFEGLRAFKQKFDPVWTPTYLASQRGLSVARILYEVNVLISGGLRGLVKRP